MIKAPNWCKDAEPTVKGWVSPKGELLKAQKFTKKQVSEWHDALKGVGKKQDVAEVIEHHEDPVEVEFDDFDELDEE